VDYTGYLLAGTFPVASAEAVEDELLAVFRDDMLRVRPVPAEQYESHMSVTGPEIESAVFRAPGPVIADRLDAIGIDAARVPADLDRTLKGAAEPATEADLAEYMLLTIKLGSKSAQQDKASSPTEIKIRRPWPPPQPESASEATGTTAVAEPPDASLSARGSAKTDYQAVIQWRTPVPEDVALRKLAYQHAVAYRDNVQNHWPSAGTNTIHSISPQKKQCRYGALECRNPCAARNAPGSSVRLVIHFGTSMPMPLAVNAYFGASKYRRRSRTYRSV
jgi:hypothetical protein